MAALNDNDRIRKPVTSTAPTKAKSRELAYSQALNKNQIDRQRSKSRESGRQTGRRLVFERYRYTVSRTLELSSATNSARALYILYTLSHCQTSNVGAGLP